MTVGGSGWRREEREGYFGTQDWDACEGKRGVSSRDVLSCLCSRRRQGWRGMVRMEGATPRRRGCGEPLSEAQTRVRLVSGTGWNGWIGGMRKRRFRWGRRCCCCEGRRGNRWVIFIRLGRNLKTLRLRRSSEFIDSVFFLSFFRNFRSSIRSSPRARPGKRRCRGAGRFSFSKYLA